MILEQPGYPDLFQQLHSIFEIIDAAFILPVRLIPVGFTLFLSITLVMPLVGGQGGSSVNPITTRGTDYAHHITASLFTRI